MKSNQILMMGAQKLSDTKYGLIYTFDAANDSRFFPSGFRLPTNAEFTSLLGGQTGETLKSITSWGIGNVATNSSGLSIRGSGFCGSNGVFYSTLFNEAKTWSGTASGSDAYALGFDKTDTASAALVDKQYGCSVRLVSSSNPGATINDYDGNTYNIILLNSLYWTVQNWKCTKYNNGDVIPLAETELEWSGSSTADICCAPEYNNSYI